jgi:hypothetical protein
VVTAGNAPAASLLPGEGAGDGARAVALPSGGEHFSVKADAPPGPSVGQCG